MPYQAGSSPSERRTAPSWPTSASAACAKVCLAYLPDIAIGEYVIVHVGFAIQRLDEQSAVDTIEQFRELGILDEEFGDGFALAAEQSGRPLPQSGGTAQAPKETSR